VTPFSPGETVVLQEVWRGRVWAARPMRVVRDDGDLVALSFPRGTQWKAPTSDPARPWNSDRGERLAECAALGDWVFRDAEWDVDTLSLMRRGDWHAVWVSWLPSGEHWGWYVNFQEPFRRSRRGFETMDLMLDLIVDADRTWRWKDEDELATFLERGVLDSALCDRIRAEGLRVAARAERNEPPFCDPWPEWRPDPAWEKPELPGGWERLWR
jgi:Protein of unknown function (DUF402)